DDAHTPLQGQSSPAGDKTALVIDKDDDLPLLLLDMATLLTSPGVLLAEGEASSAAAKAARAENTKCFLTFRVAGSWYAAAIEAVQEIVVAPMLEAHPAGIPGLRRRLVLRNRRYLVLELPDAEEGATSSSDPAAYGVIMRSEPGLYALEAEAIGTVVTVSAREVTAVPSMRGASVVQPVASSFAGCNGEGEVLVISSDALPSQPGFDAVFAHEARNATAAETASRQKAGGSDEGEGYAARLPVSLLRLDLGGELFVETASIWQSAVLPSDALFLTAAPPPGALGYLRYRGETAVVADLGALVAGQPAPRDGRHLRVIVIRAPWGLLALIVHDITGIERLWLERTGAPAAEPGGPLGGGRHIHFASARGREGRRMIGIVDLEAVVAELSASMVD
ncbi:MAG: chemotaxis protein CheW, partial [Pseudomonadota bacterium]